MAERAYWEQTNRHGNVDRIELHDSEYSGAEPELQFKGDDTGFTRQWDEITSESNDKLINIQANRIQIGKYDFRPRIEDSTGFQILEDIRDSDNKRFHIVHKIDGNFEWAGWVTTKIFSYPEKDNNFFAHIRATDFEILKGIDYPLDDTRQTFIATFADLFSELPEDTPIKTATSWVEQNVTSRVGNETYDFLAEIRHETKALREFGRTGDETDQPITKWEALEHAAEPGLLIRQMGGHVMIDQLTDLADPTSVNETVYDSTGSVTTDTQSVDRRQTGYTSIDNGTPVIKVSSQNDTYPAIRTARNVFDHRTGVNNIQFPNEILITGMDDYSDSQVFISDGSQRIQLSANLVRAITTNDTGDTLLTITIEAGGYVWTDSGWDSTGNITKEMTNKGPNPDDSSETIWETSFNIETTTLPVDADGTLKITLSAGQPGNVETRYQGLSFNIVNPVAKENSTSINYQLTQSGSYSVVLEINDTWFGDGPIGYSPAALRYGTNNSDTTTDTWRRRGQTIDYRNYHNNLLHEVIDMGRTNMRKLEAEIWGAYDPTKVLDYNGSYFYFAGGQYDGTTGSWRVTLMELNLQTDGSDDFDDIPKFTDETGSGEGTSGGGGGTDTDTLDARYVQETEIGSKVQAWDEDLDQIAGLDPSEDQIIIADTNGDWTLSTINAAFDDIYLNEDENLADLPDAVTAQGNLKLKDQTADLDLNSISVNGTNLFPDDDPQDLGTGDDVTHKDGTFTGALRGNTVRTDTGKFLSPTSYAFRNAGDSGFRNVQMAGLTATTGFFSGTLTADSLAVFNGNMDVNEDVNIDDANTNISTDTFASGFAGSGLAFLNDGDWDGTLDNLTVRQRLRVYELLINQIRATNGSLVVTSATKTGREHDLGFDPVQQQGGTLDWTSSDPFWTQTDQYWYRTYRVYIEEDQRVPFVPDDLVIAQRMTGGGTYVVEGTVINVENGAIDPTDNSTRRYFDINLTEDSDIPASGMDFVRWGNLNDPDRQGVLYLTADDDDAPYMDIVYGMDAHSKRNASGTVKGRIGRLDGITDPDFPTLDGTQTNEFGVYIDGGYFNNVEVRGTITVLGGNAATKGYSDDNLSEAKSYTDQEVTNANGSVTIRADSAPSSRPNGSDIQVGDQWIDTDNNNEPYTYDGTDPYDPSGWIRDYTIIDGGYIETGTIALNRLNFTALTSSGGTNEIIATINASSEGITIDADNITISGQTTFSSGYDPTTKTDKTDGVAIIAQDSEPSSRDSGDSLQEGDIWVDTNDSNKRYEYNGTSFVRDYTIIDGGSIETGTITATQISVTNLQAVNASTGSLDVDGTLTMGASGEITNTDRDYVTNQFGYNVYNKSSYTQAASYNMLNDSDGVIGRIWHDNGVNAMRIQTASQNDIRLEAGRASSSAVGDIILQPNSTATANGYLKVQDLPTSNPGGSNIVWNDGGTLKIT